jgi:hypothetical protein
MSHCIWLNIRQNKNCFAQKQSMIIIILRHLHSAVSFLYRASTIFITSEMYCKTITQDYTLNFQTLDYDCQSFESKRTHGVAMIWRQENGRSSAKKNKIIWFNKPKCVKRVQHYRAEFGGEPIF